MQNWDIRARTRRLINRFPYRKGAFKYRGFFIDVGLAADTGAPKKHYGWIARLHEQMLMEYTPVNSDHVVLEAGCGSGMDAILLTSQLARNGRYTGFDINKDCIDWCTENISERFPNFHFIYYDIKNSSYNPDGDLSPLEIEFPGLNGEVDRFIAQSVFTHLLPDAAAHYLSELRRVLGPDGLALITAFVGDQIEIESSINNEGTPFRFPHRYAPGVYITELEKPSDGVAYEHSIFRQMIEDAGLTVRNYIPGYWAPGRENQPHGQDVIVLTPAT